MDPLETKNMIDSRISTPVANSQSPLGNSQSPIVNSQSPIVNSQSPIVNSQSPIVNSQASAVANSQANQVANSQSPSGANSQSSPIVNSQSPPALPIKEIEENYLDKALTTACAWLPTRVAIGGLTLLGFVNLYMVRVNIFMAIVAMVNSNDTAPTNVNPEAQCLEDERLDRLTLRGGSPYISNWTEVTTNVEERQPYSDQLTGFSERPPVEKVFEWNGITQGLILASFNYGYAVTQVMGGRLAEVMGTKYVFGICILTGAIVSFLTPLMAHIHYIALIATRITLGLVQGVSWPSIHALIARWIPPLERPRFVSIVYFAATFSITLTFPLCGLVIARHGWEAVFYTSGACSLFWCFFWFTCMYDDPSEHPRITEKEKHYIQQSVRAGGKSKDPSLITPWKQIATSLPMWAIIVGDMGNAFGLAIYTSQLPTYMRNVLGYSIQKNGLVSGLPFLCRYLGAVSSGILADWLLCRGYLSIVVARKLFCSIAMFGPAILLVAVIYSGCSVTTIVVLLCLANFFNGSIAASQQVNHTDIAPNFSGTLFGISNTFAAATSSIAPVAVGAVINEVQTMEQWEKVFWMCVPVFVVAGSFFLIFGSGTVQPWNFAGQREDDDALRAVTCQLQTVSEEDEQIQIQDNEKVI
ncbi:putative inorganic phosphate cotransporter [Palaemon carinicauda]|uniref:putative inorganic phosphate cotransporter n=1 Tax=Palaemon carinicauda TaxID=392227 RepID=UPI0035B654F7